MTVRTNVNARTLRSGEVASRCGVSTDTLRFYERRGLLARPPRDASGYRRYPAAAVDRVRVIQRALDAGFTLHDLSRILKQRDAGGAPCRDVFAIAAARLKDLDARIESLVALRDRLRRTLVRWDKRLEATPRGARAWLLDSLADDRPEPYAGRRNRLRRREDTTR